MRISIVVQSNHLGALASALPGKAGAAVRKAVGDVEAQAKTRAPVDTGALRNSIVGTMTGEAAGQVTAGVNYAPYVEYGTAHAPAQPFMIPAAEAVRPSFVAAVAKAVGSL
jgi:HK97 gp10 family phage protein